MAAELRVDRPRRGLAEANRVVGVVLAGRPAVVPAGVSTESTESTEITESTLTFNPDHTPCLPACPLAFSN